MEWFEEKIRRVRLLLDELGLDAVAFTTLANFAWLTGGRENRVGLATENGACWLIVSRERVFAVCDNIEAPRIRDEELGELSIGVFEFDWWLGKAEEVVTREVGSDNWAADVAIGSRPSIEPGMHSLRARLSEEEVADYRVLGRATGLVLASVAATIESGDTEHQIAGRVSEMLGARGMVAHTVLVAADERFMRYRHPIPKANRVDRVCVLGVGARWKGLICSASRMVCFGKVPTDLDARHRAVCAVDAALISHTIPGETIADAFEAAMAEYARQGFEDEWKLHHQGGPTGYRPREIRATLESSQVILANQPFAWNPTIEGAKSEDTIIAGEPLPDILSLSDDWPRIEVETGGGRVTRHGILVK